MQGMHQQQWEPIVLRKKPSAVQTPPVDPERSRLQKIEEETATLQQLKRSFGQKVSQIRIKHGYKTQQDFARCIQERPDVVAKLEQGVITPDTQRVVTKINRVLKLFRTDDLLKLPNDK